MSYKVYKIPREMPRLSQKQINQLLLPDNKASLLARLWGDVIAVCEKLFGGNKR